MSENKKIVKRYHGRELTKDAAIFSLQRKGCKIIGFIMNLTGPKIDLTHAKNLGNKSWGCISFLLRFHGYSIIGMHEYAAQFNKFD